MDDIGTSENLWVDPNQLTRVAAAVASLPTGANEMAALVTGVARLRCEAADLASTEAAEHLVDAALARLADIAAAAATFAEDLRVAADRYVRADETAAHAITSAVSEHPHD